MYLLLGQMYWETPCKDTDFSFSKTCFLPTPLWDLSPSCCVGPLPLAQKELGQRELAEQPVPAVCGWFVALSTLWASTELVTCSSDRGCCWAVLQQLLVAVSLQGLKEWDLGKVQLWEIAWLVSLSCVCYKVYSLPSNAFVSLPSHSKVAHGPDASLDLLSSLGCFWDSQSMLPAQECLN